MIKGETVLSGAKHPGTELEVLRSPTGAFYLGFRTKDGEPYSRESGYFGDADSAHYLLRHLRT